MGVLMSTPGLNTQGRLPSPLWVLRMIPRGPSIPRPRLIPVKYSFTIASRQSSTRLVLDAQQKPQMFAVMHVRFPFAFLAVIRSCMTMIVASVPLARLISVVEVAMKSTRIGVSFKTSLTSIRSRNGNP